jgi:bacterioferritin-associated ferredoxin
MALVCLCHGVTDRRVRREIDAGARTIADLAERCAAGSCCYGCHPTLDELIAERTGAPTAVAAGPRLGIA